LKYERNVQYVGDSEDEDEEFQRALMMSTTEAEKEKKPSQPPNTVLPQPQTQISTTSRIPSQTQTSVSRTHYRTHNQSQTSHTHSQTHTQTSHTTTHSTHTTQTHTSNTQTTRASNTQPQASGNAQIRPPLVVHDVDGDVDMDLSNDPELQNALLQSLEPLDKTIEKEKARERREREKERERRERERKEKERNDRIFGEGQAAPDRYAGEEDRELQDALMASLQKEEGKGGEKEREVIDVDNEQAGRRGDAERPIPRGPIITDLDDDEDDTTVAREGDVAPGGAYEAVPEDEDAELQSALMYSLNPNQGQ
jgi:hypothetical protein